MCENVFVVSSAQRSAKSYGKILSVASFEQSIRRRILFQNTFLKGFNLILYEINYHSLFLIVVYAKFSCGDCITMI